MIQWQKLYSDLHKKILTCLNYLMKYGDDYKDELKKVFNNTVRAIKDRVLSNDFLNKLENFDTGVIEDKVKEKLNKNKDKLKNKLKSLIN